jgi:tRNA uracil 4-sulfurtransferase
VKYDLIIVRYAEIALKARQTRQRFESILINNIKTALKNKEIENKLKKEWGRIYIYTNEIESSIKVLQKIFGIKSISPAIQIKTDIKTITKAACNISKKILSKNKSFAIRATRTGKHDFSSQDIAIILGNSIVNETKASVDLINPDFEIFIEVRQDNSYIFIEKIAGPGGMPVGSQGCVLSIIDKKKDILASWYLMKRGCKIIFLNLKKSNNQILKSFTNDWFVKFNVFQTNSKKNIFENIKKTALENKCDAVITGHILSGSTILDLKNYKRNIDIPIFNPLISMNEKIVIKKCNEIGLKI